MRYLFYLLILCSITLSQNDYDNPNSYYNHAELYNERSITSSNGGLKEGNINISEFNGGLTYSYPIHSQKLGPKSSINISLVYNNNLSAITTNNTMIWDEDFIELDKTSTSLDAGVSKISVPGWILNVNGLAVQLFNFSQRFSVSNSSSSTTFVDGKTVNRVFKGWQLNTIAMVNPNKVINVLNGSGGIDAFQLSKNNTLKTSTSQILYDLSKQGIIAKLKDKVNGKHSRLELRYPAGHIVEYKIDDDYKFHASDYLAIREQSSASQDTTNTTVTPHRIIFTDGNIINFNYDEAKTRLKQNLVSISTSTGLTFSITGLTGSAPKIIFDSKTYTLNYKDNVSEIPGQNNHGLFSSIKDPENNITNFNYDDYSVKHKDLFSGHNSSYTLYLKPNIQHDLLRLEKITEPSKESHHFTYLNITSSDDQYIYSGGQSVFRQSNAKLTNAFFDIGREIYGTNVIGTYQIKGVMVEDDGPFGPSEITYNKNLYHYYYARQNRVEQNINGNQNAPYNTAENFYTVRAEYGSSNPSYASSLTYDYGGTTNDATFKTNLLNKIPSSNVKSYIFSKFKYYEIDGNATNKHVGLQNDSEFKVVLKENLASNKSTISKNTYSYGFLSGFGNTMLTKTSESSTNYKNGASYTINKTFSKTYRNSSYLKEASDNSDLYKFYVLEQETEHNTTLGQKQTIIYDNADAHRILGIADAIADQEPQYLLPSQVIKENWDEKSTTHYVYQTSNGTNIFSPLNPSIILNKNDLQFKMNDAPAQRIGVPVLIYTINERTNGSKIGLIQSGIEYVNSSKKIYKTYDPKGNVVEYSYSNYNPTVKYYKHNIIQNQSYSLNAVSTQGQPTKITVYYPNSVTNKVGVRFDNYGLKPLQAVNNYGLDIRYTYDNLYRIVNINTANMDRNQPFSTYQYSTADNKITTQTSMARSGNTYYKIESEFDFDSHGRHIGIKAYENFGKTSYRETKTEYSYDDRISKQFDVYNVATVPSYDAITLEPNGVKYYNSSSTVSSNEIGNTTTNYWYVSWASFIGQVGSYSYNYYDNFSGTYSHLIKTEIKDENGTLSYTYKTPGGHLMATKTGNIVVRYVYKLEGELMKVIHPTGLETTYTYHILSKQLATKTEVDRGITKYAYDKFGRLKYSQDAKQRTLNQFSFFGYDVMDRPTYTGIYTDVNNIWFDGRVTTNPVNNSYNSTQEPVSKMISYNFYDKKRTSWNGISFSPVSDISGISSTAYAGQLRYSLWRPTTTSSWSMRAYDYDIFDRVTKIHHQNGSLLTSTFYDYDFLNRVTKKQNRVKYGSSTKSDVYEWYAYNDMGEVDEVKRNTSNNSSAAYKVAEYTYKKHGAIAQLKLANGAQSVDYSYNSRGWLSSINNPNSLGSDLFGMNLHYWSGNPSGITVKRNGNVASVESKASGEQEIQLGYYYDYNNRLIKSRAFGYYANDPGEFITTYSYDNAGNILSLTRKKL